MNYYEDVARFIRDRFDQPRIVEIGTAFGGLADHLAGELRRSNVYAVDPFLAGYDPQDYQSNLYSSWMETRGMSNSLFSKCWASALVTEQRARHGCRYHQLNMMSKDAALLFLDQSVDVIFIDGLHTYEGVATDILAWLPKMIRPGGVMIFNDVHDIVDVNRAVRDFQRSLGLEVYEGKWNVPPGNGNAAVIL